MVDDFTYTVIKILVKFFIFVLTAFGIYLIGYHEAYEKTTYKYERMMVDAELRSQERLKALQHDQNKEVSAYLDRISALETQHQLDVENLKNAELKDTIEVDVTAVSNCNDNGMHKREDSTGKVRKAGTESNLICYTRSDIQRKIEESLVITKECDRLVEQYRTLLAVCGKE